MQFTSKQLILMLVFFWAALLPGSALAEQQADCLRLKELRAEYDAVAKGTRMPVDVKLNTHGCHLPVSRSSNVTLTATQPGFELKLDDRSYGKVKKSENPGVAMADELKLVVWVTIHGELAPGDYEIPAVLNYEASNGKGEVAQESMGLVIPVKVAASVAQVHYRPRPDPWKPLKITGEVAAIAVLLPVVIGLGFIQMLTGISILPDC